MSAADVRRTAGILLETLRVVAVPQCPFMFILRHTWNWNMSVPTRGAQRGSPLCTMARSFHSIYKAFSNSSELTFPKRMECIREGDTWHGYNIFSNFSSFKALLDEIFAKHLDDDDPALHENVTHLMSQIQFNPEVICTIVSCTQPKVSWSIIPIKEWKAHAKLHAEHFTRVLLGQSDRWMLILTCWDKDQGTPIHDHQGSYNWIKVELNHQYET